MNERTDWTDADLEALLRETFASREPLAEAGTARRLADVSAQRRRTWPAYVLAAAAVVLVAIVAAALAGRDTTTEPAPPVDAPSPLLGGTYAENRQVALAEARRVLDAVPLPEGAVPIAAPKDWPLDGSASGTSDPALRQTAWWSVDLPGAEVGDALRAARPGEESGTTSATADGVRYEGVSWNVPAAQPQAMAGLVLAVQWADVGGETLVRAEVATAARAPRTPETVVPDDVTAVDVVFRPRAGTGPSETITRTLTAHDDADAVSALVAAVNGLPGSARPLPSVFCTAGGEPTELTLTFHTPDGALVARDEGTCSRYLELSRDGVPLRPTLDLTGLDEAVEAVLR